MLTIIIAGLLHFTLETALSKRCRWTQKLAVGNLANYTFEKGFAKAKK